MQLTDAPQNFLLPQAVCLFPGSIRSMYRRNSINYDPLPNVIETLCQCRKRPRQIEALEMQSEKSNHTVTASQRHAKHRALSIGVHCCCTRWYDRKELNLAGSVYGEFCGEYFFDKKKTRVCNKFIFENCFCKTRISTKLRTKRWFFARLAWNFFQPEISSRQKALVPKVSLRRRQWNCLLRL